MLDPNLCRRRQRRLLDRLQQRPVDALVVGLPAHVQYLSGFQTNWLHQSAFVLFGDGRSWLITANAPASGPAADEIVAYEAQWNATLRQEQPHVAGEFVVERLRRQRAVRVGVDASMVTSQLPLMAADEVSFESIDPMLWQLRRVKDADE